MTPPITGLSSMATRQILADLARDYEERTGQPVSFWSLGGVEAARLVRDGEPDFAHRGGPDRRGWAADRAGLGGEIQRAWSRRAAQRQGARSALPARRRASSRTQGAARGWPDPGCPRRGALASDRSDGLAVGGVPRHDLKADTEPRAAGDELSQALGPSAPSRQERGGC